MKLELRFENFELPAADFGDENCLPDIHNNAYIRTPIDVSDRVTEEEKRLVGKGLVTTLIPYTTQDGYNRARNIRGFKSAVLENEYLKATFIPELGGRLWSLYDKKEDKELLYDNNVFQPGNLALRNAWFSGGVEWNVGIKGHNPLTCDPLFAQECTNKNGDPILVMYEFERIRGVVYTIKATLEKDVLLVGIEIENTSDQDVYMYWWSNIAVPETKSTRIIVPTEESFVCSYFDGGYFLDTCSLPVVNEVDVTYPTRATKSADYFYKIPDNESKWIAAIDDSGKGLVQFSDDTLKGRKLFLWGQHNGGKHWNKWLTDREDGYIEIQAGLLKTQLEHFVMERNSSISWTEGYSLAKCDAKAIHSTEYTEAIRSVGSAIKDKQAYIDSDFLEIAKEGDIIYCGSGWGALENILRDKPISKKRKFPITSLDRKQESWLDLIQKGRLAEYDVKQPIVSYVTGNDYVSALEKIQDKNWYELYHLGVLYYTEGQIENAEDAFRQSVAKTPNAWSFRNLAQIYKNIYKDSELGAKYMLSAFELNSEYLPLVTETAYALINNMQYQKWLDLYENLSEELRRNGRLQMLNALCYTKLKQVKKALEIMRSDICVYDIREGEYSLSGIWMELHGIILAGERGISEVDLTAEEILEVYPLPFELDFRMH